MIPVDACLELSGVLFGIGMIGFLARRNIAKHPDGVQ